MLSTLHLGSSRTGDDHWLLPLHLCETQLVKHTTCLSLLLTDGVCNGVHTGQVACLGYFVTGHNVYRLMCIATQIYDIRRPYGGTTEPRARSALLSHAHRCNTSLDTILVRIARRLSKRSVVDALRVHTSRVHWLQRSLSPAL
jgi:hypothetical protein